MATQQDKDAFRAACRRPIASLEDARAYLLAMIAADMAYHLEDDPAEVISTEFPGPVFDEPDLVRARADELYALPRKVWGKHDCPIGFMMALEEKRA